MRETMLREGGLHGSLHALRGEFLDRIRGRGFRIPAGLYRGDGLIGSFVMHDLDAIGSPWDTGRILPVPMATWSSRGLMLASLPRHLLRRIRQARGRFENEAIKKIIYSAGYGALPHFADQMILDYLASTDVRVGMLDMPSRLALRQLARPRMPSVSELTPVTLACVMPERFGIPGLAGSGADRAA
jgi:hypothetical protein